MLESIQNSNSMMINAFQMGNIRPPKFQPLTDQQKSQLSEILSQYDPENITMEMPTRCLSFTKLNWGTRMKER
jgi:hypothetical protein